jgi:hypothetical protein
MIATECIKTEVVKAVRRSEFMTSISEGKCILYKILSIDTISAAGRRLKYQVVRLILSKVELVGKNKNIRAWFIDNKGQGHPFLIEEVIDNLYNREQGCQDKSPTTMFFENEADCRTYCTYLSVDLLQ